MKVSIITVCRNAASTLETTIRAVLEQTYAAIEYIVIDGASDDGTLEILQRYQARIALLISEPDQGIYQAMNKGIQRATGDWLYFANADDYLFDATVIQDLVQFVSEHPDCNLIYGNHEARFISGDRAIYQPVPPEKMLAEMVCLGDDHLHQPTSFFKASLFQQIGLFNETYRIAADYEWFLRCLQSPTLRLAYCPRPVVSYAHGGASGNIKALFTEVFAIQNQDPICQQPEWLVQRLDKLQTMFVEKYDLLERTNQLSLARLRHIEGAEARIQALEAQIVELRTTAAAKLKAQNQALKAELEAAQSQSAALQAQIEAMKTSKFWRLRSKWFQLKQRIGLPGDNA